MLIISFCQILLYDNFVTNVLKYNVCRVYNFIFKYLNVPTSRSLHLIASLKPALFNENHRK